MNKHKAENEASLSEKNILKLNDILNTDEILLSKNKSIPHLPFILGNSFGYFADADETGIILSSGEFKNHVSISSFFWATYGMKPAFTDIYSSDNFIKPLLGIDTKNLTVEKEGYVHIEDDRIFLFEPGGNIVSNYTQEGKMRWRYVHSAPITAFQSSHKGCVIGYSDGLLVCLDENGNKLFKIYPGGSDYQVIFSASISQDGSKIVCVCGLNNQRVILIDVSGKHHKIIYHTYLKKDMRRQLFANFDSSSRFAVFESGDGIGIIDCKTLELSMINESGAIIGMGNDAHKNFLTLLLQKDSTCSILAINPPHFLIGKTEFNSKNSFLIQSKNKIYLGSGDGIASFSIKGLK